MYAGMPWSTVALAALRLAVLVLLLPRAVNAAPSAAKPGAHGPARTSTPPSKSAGYHITPTRLVDVCYPDNRRGRIATQKPGP
jgi:hypothetical protein